MKYFKSQQQPLLILTKSTLLSVSINLMLAIMKIMGGIFGRSHVLIADGIHSLSDLVYDCLVYLGGYIGGQDPDECHPYGHGKIESLISIILAAFLLITALIIIYDGIHIYTYGKARPGNITLIIVILSIILNEVVYRHMVKYATQINSELLLLNAWHHRQDAFASLAVLIGTIGALFGYSICESIASIVIGGFVSQLALNIVKKNVRELVDYTVNPSHISHMVDIIMKVDGVKDVYNFRARTVAGKILLDAHVVVDPIITVSEGFFITQQITRTLKEHIAEVVDVSIHVVPGDRHTEHIVRTRSEILFDLKNRWGDLIEINRINIHYLHKNIFLEVYFNSNFINDVESLKKIKKLCLEKTKDLEYIDNISFYSGGNLIV